MPRPVNPTAAKENNAKRAGSGPPAEAPPPSYAGSSDTTARPALARLWTIRSLDPEVDLTISGQYPLRQVQDRRAVRLDALDTAGPSAGPVLSAGAAAASVAFDTEFRSLDYGDDLRPILDKLRALRLPDPQLGRHVRIRFEAPGVTLEGKASRVEIAVSSSWVTGLPRVVTVGFELVEDGGGAKIETERPTVRETVHVVLGSFETWEHLAARFLGDPSKGPLVRQINPEVSRDAPEYNRRQGGQEPQPVSVRIFEADHPAMRREVLPFSLQLGAVTFAGQALASRLEELADERFAPGFGGASSAAFEELQRLVGDG